MKVTYLGTGVWGFCLQNHLAKLGHKVLAWTIDENIAKTRKHPHFPKVEAHPNLRFTLSMEEALENFDLLVESVSTAGIRPVFTEVIKHRPIDFPVAITSKGIERDTGKLVTEVIAEIAGEPAKEWIGYLSGPSYADEVIYGLPTSVVAAGKKREVVDSIVKAFNGPTFRVYPNNDVLGVALGGALKNTVAIACGISGGLKYGQSATAALITRGLHEMHKLALAKGAKSKTLYGLSGMGDLVLTCSSPLSRNYRFGELLAQGLDPESAKKEIGMVVEGAFTCVAAHKLAGELNIALPITEMVYAIIYEGLSPEEAVTQLMQREVKEEHL